MLVRNRQLKRSNLVVARNASKRQITLTTPPVDYKKLAIEMSSGPLEGKIGEMKVERDRHERELIERGEYQKPDKREHNPRFDDLY